MNGRIGHDKALGRYTFRNTSVIDYTLCTADVFKYLTMFEVIDMDPLFSNGHCLLSTRGWSGGAMVLGKLLVPGRPTCLD